MGRALREWECSLMEKCDLSLVGGSVRDILLGRTVDTVDNDYVACGIGLESLVSILEGFGRTDLVGKSFGVIKFTAPGQETVDISLPRSEVSTGTGHRDFEVKSDPSIPLSEDLRRRDFTINSIALDLKSMELVDPLGGRGDLEKGILRVNRDNSFIEDPLRILRGVQFMSRFDLQVDARTAALMKEHAALLESVSRERVRMELDKLLLLSERPGSGLVFMHDTGILPLILHELDETWGVEQNEFHPDDVFHHSIKSCDSSPQVLHIRLAALFHDLGKKKMKKEVGGKIVFYRHEEVSARIAEDIMKRLLYSCDMIDRVTHLVANHMFYITQEWSDGAVRRFIAKIGPENIDDIFTLRLADGRSRGDDLIEKEVGYARARIEKVMTEDAAFKRADLAIGGVEIMKVTGLGPGKQIGKILESLLDIVLEHPEYNNREKLEELAREAGVK